MEVSENVVVTLIAERVAATAAPPAMFTSCAWRLPC